MRLLRISNIYLQFLLAMTLIAVIPLTVVGLGIATLDRRALVEQSARELSGIASALVGELNVKLDGLLRDTDIIASLPSITSMSSELQSQVLKELFLHNDQFNALDVLSLEGKMLASSHPNRQPVIEPLIFDTVSSNGLQVWSITIDPNNNQRILLIYAPIRNAERQVVGVLAGSVNLHDLSSLVRKVQAGSSRAFVLDSAGHILLHPDSEIMQQAGSGPWQAAFNRKELVGIGTTSYLVDGELFDAGFASLADFNWTVLVERLDAEVVAPAQRAYYLTLLAVLLTAGSVFVTVLWLAGQLTRPIRDLAAAAQAFGAGNAAAPLPELSSNTGELGALVTAFREMRQAVTEREEALRQSEQRLALHARQTPLAVIEFDLNLNVVEWNPGAEKIFGYTRRETIGRSVAELLVPEHLREHVQGLRQALLEQRGGTRSTNQNLTKSGDIITCEWYNTPLVDPQGNVIAFASLVQDITERVEIEKQLRLMELVVSNTSESVLITEVAIDEPGPLIVYVNQAFTRMTGYSAGEVIGLNPRILQGPRTDRAQLDKIRAALTMLQPVQVELINYRKDGSEFWVDFSIAPLKDKKGQVTHFVSVQRDVTDRKRAEEEIQRAKDALAAERASLARRVEERTAELSAANAQLAQANRLKDEFLAAMSHELRTPLNAILGMSEALLEQVFGPINLEQQDSLNEITHSGRHLLELINDILDLSKIEADKLELIVAPVSVPSICQAVLWMVKRQALEKEIKVVSTIDHSANIIEADERRLKQILVNLLSNAVKFTPAGGQVGLEVMVDDEQANIQFTVWDTGIGIAQADMANLFQPFVQLDSRLSRRYEGTGLGLALVYRLTEMHGGSVSVKSEPGQGSRFTVSLPRSAASANLATDDSEPQEAVQPAKFSARVTPAEPAGPLILLVEDNQVCAKTTTRYLRQHGYRLAVARNGTQAVDMAQDKRPNLILMDIQMPEMDGLQAIARLRQNPNFDTTPIIALTALAMPGDREKCLAAGASEYLSKPVNMANLVKTIERHLNRPKPTGIKS